MIKVFRNLQKKDWLCFGCAVVFIVCQVWLDLKMPDYMSEITVLVQTPGSAMADVWAAGGRMLLCALGSLASSVAVSVFAARIATDFGADLRYKLFHKVMSFSMGEYGTFSTPSLITRTTNDVMQVQMLVVMGLQSIVKAPIMSAWAISKIAGKSGEWTLSTAAAVGILLVLVIVSVVLVMPRFRRLQKLTDDLNRVTRENLNGLRVVRAYNAEGYQEEKFERANESLMRTQLFTGRVMAALMPGIQIVMNGLSLAIFWIGAWLINGAGMTEKVALFADMVVFSQYAMQVVMSFMMLVMIFIIYPRAAVSARRILAVLDTQPAVLDGHGDTSGPHAQGSVEFRDVSFRYPDGGGDTLHHISFTADQGETVAIIGATGCGKSTVVNLIPRFYDATEGEVLVDGVNVKDYTQKQLRNKLGYISQRAAIFSGTIKDNIAFGDNGREGFTQSDIAEAACTAQAAEFIEKLPDTYDGYVSQSGTNLSGGQKQRLSIARAVCRRPEILIFDDSFSALDYKTDRALRKQLEKDCAGVTKIIVAQRIGTIRDADRILVLDEGRIVGMGTHEQLMDTCEIYRQIAYSQLSKEELA